MKRLAWHRRWIALIPMGVAAVASAAGPVDAPEWVLSKDGDYVIDLKTKQAWPRCVEGMIWNGKTCTGEPLLFTHAEAIALAAAKRDADGVPWHLPRVTELQRPVKGRSSGLDPLLFPAAPLGWHWSSTSNVNGDTRPVNPYNYGNIAQGRTNESVTHMAFLHGWAVNLTTGQARGDVKKKTALPVRLVRPQP